MQQTNNYFLGRLPEEFSRQDVLKLVVKEGYSTSRANQFLEFGTLSDLFKRVGRGKYIKIKDRASQAIEMSQQGLSYREIGEQLGISKTQVGNLLNGSTGQGGQ